MADVLAIGAHPDDIELTMGGTLVRLRDAGCSVALLDLTRGEAATRGTPETRAAEAMEAARLLGAEDRVILDHGDGHLSDTMEVRRSVVDAIRRHRPRLVFAPHWDDLHPDHAAAGAAVRAVRYTSGMTHWFPGEHPPHRARTFLFSMHHTPFAPSVVVDVTPVWERALALAHCFQSQLHQPDSAEPATNIASEDFLVRWEARHRWFGGLTGATYGQAFFHDGPLAIGDASVLL